MAIIELDAVEKSYGSLAVLKGIDLSVEEGEIFGLLGPNGAGKTTLFQTIIGLLQPDAGEILIDGIPHDRGKDIKRKMSYLSADASFYGHMTARQNLDYFAQLAEMEPDIDELLELAGLQDSADRNVAAFSTGMKKRLGIAQSMIKDPDILIYDEPTTGLDPAGKRQFRQLVERINHEHGKTVVISSHVTTEIDSLCDRFGILNNGVIAACGTKEELSTHTDNVVTIYLEVEQVEKAESVLQGMDVQFQQGRNGIEIDADTDIRSDLFRRLVEQDVAVKTLELHEETLESAYLELTEG